MNKYGTTKITPQRISPEIWGPPNEEVQTNMAWKLSAENERLRAAFKEIAKIILRALEK